MVDKMAQEKPKSSLHRVRASRRKPGFSTFDRLMTQLLLTEHLLCTKHRAFYQLLTEFKPLQQEPCDLHFTNKETETLLGGYMPKLTKMQFECRWLCICMPHHLDILCPVFLMLFPFALLLLGSAKPLSSKHPILTMCSFCLAASSGLAHSHLYPSLIMVKNVAAKPDIPGSKPRL